MGQQIIKKYQQGDVILAQGEAGRGLLRVFAGEVGLYIHYGRPEQRLLCTLGPLDYFGEVCALTGGPCAYTAVASKPVTLLQIPEGEIPAHLGSNPQNTVHLLQLMARRTAFLEEVLREVSQVYYSGSARIFSHLMEKMTGCKPAHPIHSEDRSPSETLAALAEEAARLEQEAAMLQQEVNALMDSASALEQEAAVLESELQRAEMPSAVEQLFLPGHRSYPGVTHPEYKEHLFTKKYVCPCCKVSFSTQQTFYSGHHLIAAPTPEEARYDLRIFYKDFDSSWYDIITCPSCYFSAFHDMFGQGKMLRRERFEKQLEEVAAGLWLNMDAERDLDFVFAQHYLALLCAPGFFSCRQVQSRLWINLYWLYKSAGDEEMALLADNEARTASEIVYRECDLNPAQTQHICLRIASMHRRAGNLKTAREWAFRVRSNRMGKEAYRRLAESLIEDVREDAERLAAGKLAADLAAKREAERLAQQEQALRLQQEAEARAAKKAEQKAARAAALESALDSAQANQMPQGVLQLLQ